MTILFCAKQKRLVAGGQLDQGQLPVYLAALVSVALVVPPLSSGHEPAAEFVRELQSRGYDELALTYLERLESTELASPEFRERLDYEQGEVLIRAATRQRSLAAKAAYLDRAQAEFERFGEQHPQHALALSAQGKLGTIMMERARIVVAQADLPATDSDRRATLKVEARRLFSAAAQTYQRNQAAIRARLEQIPKSLNAEKDAALIAERDQLRADYVQAMFVAAMVLYEQSQSYDAQDPVRRELLVRAEQAFGTVAQKYRQRIAGLSASLFQGRCQQQLGEPRKALVFFEDLLALPEGEPAVRPLVTRALQGAMECWLSPEINQLETSRQRAEAWLERQRPDERSDDNWLAVKYLLAQTYLQLASVDETGRDRNTFRTEARKLAIDVAKYRGDWQKSAQDMLGNLGTGASVAAPADSVTTFMDAVAAAREALSQRQIAAQTVTTLEQRVSAATSDEQRAAVNAALDEAQGQIRSAEATAMEYLKQAQQLTADETPIEQLNQVRYYLCTLYYFREDFYAASVLADFLSSRFPATEEGRRAAAVSLASLGRLYGTGQSAAAPRLRQRMIRTAERIAEQWKGQPEADDALATLVSLAVAENKSEQALGYLERMSPESPRRAAAELAAGQALWEVANRQQAASAPTDGVATQRAQAVTLMTQGLRRGGAAGASPSTIAATLSVAQHLVGRGNSHEACELLQDPTFGPLTLADQDHPLLSSAELKQRVYLLSIMALVGSLADAEQPQPLLDRALQILDRLKDVAGTGSQQQQQLSTAYVMLARNLQTQIETAAAPRRPMLVKAFEQFLARAAESARELSVLTWVAESYAGLAQATLDGDGLPTQESRSFSGRAVEEYRQILRRIERGDFTVTLADQVMLESRLATAYREEGDYAAAIERFTSVLARENNQVYIQLEAAKTLLAWGVQGNPAAFEKAIVGDRVDASTGRNLIWGYARIAKAVAGKPQLSELFFAARLAIAQCRYQAALQQTAGERRTQLEQAEREITLTSKLYPQLGGPARKAEFQGLLRQIQLALGKNPTELP